MNSSLIISKKRCSNQNVSQWWQHFYYIESSFSNFFFSNTHLQWLLLLFMIHIEVVRSFFFFFYISKTRLGLGWILKESQNLASYLLIIPPQGWKSEYFVAYFFISQYIFLFKKQKKLQKISIKTKNIIIVLLWKMPKWNRDSSRQKY